MRILILARRLGDNKKKTCLKKKLVLMEVKHACSQSTTIRCKLPVNRHLRIKHRLGLKRYLDGRKEREDRVVNIHSVATKSIYTV
jgi:hypothetical protein